MDSIKKSYEKKSSRNKNGNFKNQFSYKNGEVMIGSIDMKTHYGNVLNSHKQLVKVKAGNEIGNNLRIGRDGKHYEERFSFENNLRQTNNTHTKIDINTQLNNTNNFHTARSTSPTPLNQFIQPKMIFKQNKPSGINTPNYL